MKLGQILLMWRKASELSVRDAAVQIGIPFSTLYRIECGDQMEVRTLVRVLIWMLGEA